MRKVLITESSLRDLLRELMNSHAPIFPNPVVDPQAAETNPTNINFVPDDKTELLSALRMLITNVDDENVPQVYVAIKDAIEKEEEEMKGTKAEAIIRSAVRKILKESFLSEETAAEKRERLSKIAHSKPTYMLVSPEIAEEFNVTSVETVGDKVKVDISSLTADQRVGLIAANRKAGTFSKPGELGKSPSQEEKYQKFLKSSAELREKLNSSTYLQDQEKKIVLDYLESGQVEGKNIYEGLEASMQGANVKSAAHRFFKAFNNVKDVITAAKNEGKISEDEFNFYLTPSILINGKLFSKAFKGNFNEFSQKLGLSILKSITEKGYYSGEGESLQKIADEIGLSVAAVRKISLIALGKFVITLTVLGNESEFMQYLDVVDPEDIVKYSALNPESK